MCSASYAHSTTSLALSLQSKHLRFLSSLSSHPHPLFLHTPQILILVSTQFTIKSGLAKVAMTFRMSLDSVSTPQSLSHSAAQKDLTLMVYPHCLKHALSWAWVMQNFLVFPLPLWLLSLLPTLLQHVAIKHLTHRARPFLSFDFSLHVLFLHMLINYKLIQMTYKCIALDQTFHQNFRPNDLPANLSPPYGCLKCISAVPEFNS